MGNPTPARGIPEGIPREIPNQGPPRAIWASEDREAPHTVRVWRPTAPSDPVFPPLTGRAVVREAL